MKKATWIIVVVLTIFLAAGCGSEDAKRVAELNRKNLGWESEIVIADPDMPDMEHFSIMYDSYDASLAEAMAKDQFSADFIPESVMAFKTDMYRNKPREITINIGDRVSVIECKKNNEGREVCLVRTEHGTYAWLFSFHLLDEDGERMGTYR